MWPLSPICNLTKSLLSNYLSADNTQKNLIEYSIRQLRYFQKVTCPALKIKIEINKMINASVSSSLLRRQEPITGSLRSFCKISGCCDSMKPSSSTANNTGSSKPIEFSSKSSFFRFLPLFSKKRNVYSHQEQIGHTINRERRANLGYPSLYYPCGIQLSVQCSLSNEYNIGRFNDFNLINFTSYTNDRNTESNRIGSRLKKPSVEKAVITNMTEIWIYKDTLIYKKKFCSRKKNLGK
ncbi:hypothetical protein AGLY_007673 [Aphis glycines]|uniref:Uncharacterized protein n=1 Tax=Aphis glycines TaxID=307491 RepID=A0A6G0TMP5_APHGL|nr:hypothetical protein AGLY_007673 [Aphis glycines]